MTMLQGIDRFFLKLGFRVEERSFLAKNLVGMLAVSLDYPQKWEWSGDQVTCGKDFLVRILYWFSK